MAPTMLNRKNTTKEIKHDKWRPDTPFSIFRFNVDWACISRIKGVIQYLAVIPRYAIKILARIKIDPKITAHSECASDSCTSITSYWRTHSGVRVSYD